MRVLGGVSSGCSSSFARMYNLDPHDQPRQVASSMNLVQSCLTTIMQKESEMDTGIEQWFQGVYVAALVT